MKKHVKIITVAQGFESRAETELSRLVSEGWDIVVGGGFGTISGFVVLQKAADIVLGDSSS